MKSALLRGRRILVTRPAAQAAALADMISAEGGEAICFPLLEIGPVDETEPLRVAAAHLADYDFVVFISPNAVDYGLPPLLAGRVWPSALQAVAIGPGTVSALARYGVERVLVPHERYDSGAVLALPAFQPAAVRGRRCLIMRGNGGRELLADTLQARGATVSCVSCYRRSAPQNASRLVDLLRNEGLDALTLSSSEGLRNLWSLLDPADRQRLAQLPLFVPHVRIAEEAAALGLKKVRLTAPADAGIMDALLVFEAFSQG